MPGLCGIVDLSAPASAAAADVARMLERLTRFGWQQARSLDAAGASFGHVVVNPVGAVAPSGLAVSGDISLVVDGELYPHAPAGQRSTADTLVALASSGFLARLEVEHGSFSCAVWDARSTRLSLATDRFGTRPVYWAQVGQRFLFASEISALLAVAGLHSDCDEEGLAQFLCFGQYLGDTTLYKAVRVVPAGSWLTFDARSGGVTFTPFRCLPAQQPSSDGEWCEAVDAAATTAVARSCEAGGALGLSLSGGLDARTILGLAPRDVSLTCVSLGIPGSIDHRAAAALAHLAGQKHHALMLADDFLSRFESLLKQMVDLTDGQYLDQGIVLTTLPAYRDLGIQTLLRGHAGELMHMSKAYAFSVDDAALRLSSNADLVDWLWRHLTAYMIGDADESVFSGRRGRGMREMARASLQRQVSRWDHVEPVPQRIWHLFVAERLRRETALSLQVFRNFVEVRVPLLEPLLVELLLAAPPHLKIDDHLQTQLLGRHRPSFLRVVNANTGAPLGASPLRTRLAYTKLRIYSKLRVPGYQPYERLGLWLAESLQPLLRRALLESPEGSPVPLERDAIRRLIDQHRTRRRNHTFLLMALVTLAFSTASRREQRFGEPVGLGG